MKLFLSWSGRESRQIAEALRDWIPTVIELVEPFMSTDLPKGSLWLEELGIQLSEHNYGIICLTPNNLDAPWPIYEAGALRKYVERPMITPLLFEVRSVDDIAEPLRLFQATRYVRGDILNLMWRLNELSGRNLTEQTFKIVFDKQWPKLKKRLDPIAQTFRLEEAVRPDEPRNPDLAGIFRAVQHQTMLIERSTGDRFFTYRGNERISPLSGGDYHHLALGFAMLKHIADSDAHRWHIPDDSIMWTLAFMREPLEIILGRGFAPHIHSVYFDDEHGPLRITFVEGERDVELTIGDDLDEVPSG